MIKPTNGRIVHYFADGSEGFQAYNQPLAAMIAHVWHDRMVNLTVSDANGIPHGVTSVTLVQPGEAVPPGRYCRWMDYQLGQAARTEAAEAQLKEQNG